MMRSSLLGPSAVAMLLIAIGCGTDDPSAVTPSADASADGASAGDAGVANDGSTSDAALPTGGPASLAVDPGWNGGALAVTTMRESSDAGYQVFRQPSGKIVVGGINVSNTALFLARVDAAGTALDPTFGIGGRILVQGRPGAAMGGVAMQADGRLIVALSQLAIGGSLTRFDANGAVDTTFGSGGRIVFTDMSPQAIAVQSDGAIVAVGGSVTPPGYAFTMRRFTAAGALDATFGGTGTVTIASGPGTEMGNGIAFAPDGKILATSVNPTGILVRRFTTLGVLDTTWAGTGIAQTTLGMPLSLAYYRGAGAQPDGKVVVAGKDGSSWVVRRLDALGVADATFAGTGTATITSGGQGIEALAVTSTGAIYVSAPSTVYRLQPGGAPDAAFAGGSRAVGFGVRTVAALADGSVLATGTGAAFDVAVGHVNADGALDPAFGTAGRTAFGIGASRDEILSLALQPDGKIIAAGHALKEDEGWVAARYTASGVLDDTFGSGGKLFGPMSAGQITTRSVAVDGAGNVVVAGGIVDFAAARYTPTGQPDGGFGVAGQRRFQVVDGKNAQCQAMTLDKNGRVVLVGASNTVAGAFTSFGVARLTSAGEIDAAFAGGRIATEVGRPGGASTALAVAVESDGKVLAAGTASARLPRADDAERYVRRILRHAGNGDPRRRREQRPPCARAPARWQAGRRRRRVRQSDRRRFRAASAPLVK